MEVMGDMGGGVEGFNQKPIIKNFVVLCETKNRKCYIFLNNCAFNPKADLKLVDEGRQVKS